MSTPTSKASSTQGTTSNPSEAEVLRAIHARGLPCWDAEGLASLLASRLGATARTTRALLDGLDVRVEVAGPALGHLDETWLFRAPAAGEPFDARIEGVEGVVEWELLDERYALVRTLAYDAIERERRLRELHKRLHERPLHQLHREHPAPPKRRLTRLDWALLSAMRRKPFAPIDALAAEAGASLRVAKERAPKLAAEGIATVLATPRASPLARVLVRVSPSSTAAARHALDVFGPSLVQDWVPTHVEASLVDATLAAPPAAWDALRERALDVPGVARVETLAVTKRWRDEAAFDALVKQAFSAASG